MPSFRIQPEPNVELWSGGAAPPPAPVATTLYHVFVTGQSNAIGRDALPIVSSGAPALMFNGGLAPGGSSAALASLVPLVEGTGYAAGQTICSGMARVLAAALPAQPLLFSVAGDDNKKYEELAKGSSYYAEHLAQASAAAAIAAGMGLAYRVLCVCALHGEADQAFQKTDYGPHVADWSLDYNADLGLISGQEQPIPLLIGQQAGYAPDNPDNSQNFACSSALELEEAHQVDPARVVIPAPQYIFDHGANGLHLLPWSHLELGEYFGAAAIRSALAGLVFWGLALEGATLSGARVTLSFHVPAAPLRFEFDRALYQPNYGFAYADADNSAYILSVEITGPAEVAVTLSNPPTGANPEIRYACDTYNEDRPKFGNGKGNLCDSSAAAAPSGLILRHYCQAFRRLL